MTGPYLLMVALASDHHGYTLQTRAQVEDVAAYFDTRPLPEERVARLCKVFKLGGGQNQGQGGKKGGKKANKGGGGGGGGGSGGQEEEAAAEDLEHAIISRVAAKHVS